MGLYQEILKDAADFKIMVNFHGCTLPRGWSRTYPHLMSMEAVRGEESHLFDKTYPALAPRHNATLPFTRNVVGPMDDTPTMFQDNVNHLVTTPGHEIALPVVFESGLLHFAGGPEEYRKLPAAPKEFLQRIPVVWDETRFLQGDPGKFAVIVRRAGELWYVGGINGGEIRHRAKTHATKLDTRSDADPVGTRDCRKPAFDTANPWNDRAVIKTGLPAPGASECIRGDPRRCGPAQEPQSAEA